MGAPTIGFARLPKAVRDLLAEAAADASAAAAALDALARDPRQRPRGAEIVSLEDDADRVTHELQRALATARVASQERGQLLHAIEAIDDILDVIDDTAQALPPISHALPHDRLSRTTAVIKDLVRTCMAAPARIEEPLAAREALHERAHALDDELRVELRALQRAVADSEADVLVALRATGLLRQLRSIGQAAIRALRAIEVLAGAHV
jgi:uncharacterized protein Yka (UPF0111/DUF47 family)